MSHWRGCKYENVLTTTTTALCYLDRCFYPIVFRKTNSNKDATNGFSFSRGLKQQSLHTHVHTNIFTSDFKLYKISSLKIITSLLSLFKNRSYMNSSSIYLYRSLLLIFIIFFIIASISYASNDFEYS